MKSFLSRFACGWIGVLWVVAVVGCSRPASPVSAPIAAAGGSPSTEPRIERDAAEQVISLAFFGQQVTDRDLQQLDQYPALPALRLQECRQLTDGGLSALVNVKHLKKLELIQVGVTDDALRQLQPLSSLDELVLGQTKVTGAGLRHLASVPLRRLSLHSRVATAQGLAELASLASLQELELHCPQLTLRDIPSLGSLRQLKSLVATRTPVGQGGLEVLRANAALRKLKLMAGEVDDASLTALNDLQALEELELAGATITDAVLKQLSLPNLKTLALDSCSGITDAGLSNFGGMPKLEILNLFGTSVAGLDLKGLGSLKNLKHVIVGASHFKGNDGTIAELKKLLPECEFIVLRG